MAENIFSPKKRELERSNNIYHIELPKIELSHDQKLILVTLYQAGVLYLKCKPGYFKLYNAQNEVVGELQFNRDNEFNFNILVEKMMHNTKYFLPDIIDQLAPEYKKIISNSNF